VFAPLNSTMLAVALPSIRDEFHVSIGTSTWLVSAYLIAVAVCQPAGGRLGDALGHRRLMLMGLAVLATFTVLAPLATNFWLLVGLRTGQGISAGLIAPNGMAYVRTTLRPDLLGGAMGINGSIISMGAAIGPVIGGLLVAAGGWELVFWSSLPLVALAAALVLALPGDRGAGLRSMRAGWDSLAWLLATFTGMTLAGTALRRDSATLGLIAAVCVSAGIIGYAATYAVRKAGVVDLALFKARSFAAGSAGTALGNLVMYTTLVAMPAFLGDLHNVGDAAIGGILFLMSIFMVVMSPFSGRYADRIGPKRLILAGAAVMVVSAALLASVADGGPLWGVFAALILVGVALGLMSGPQSLVAMRAIPPAQAGSASGTYSLMRYVGSVLGTAILAATAGVHGSGDEYRLLFSILLAFAGVNLLVVVFVQREAPTPPVPAEGRPGQRQSSPGTAGGS
jgi:MFS family permease